MSAAVDVTEIGPERPDHPDKPDHLITVFVVNDDGDSVPHHVRGGEWIVRKLKKKLHIDDSLVLAVITASGLKDLDDEARIHIHEGEKFMAHARDGASS